MNFNKMLSNLLRRLLKRMVGYLPEIEYSPDIQLLLGFSIGDYIGRLLYISLDKGIDSIQIPEALRENMKKKSHLDKNLFYLINQKEKMNEKIFSILLKRYMEYVNIACLVSETMNSDVRTYFPNESAYVYNTFLVQKNTMNEHRRELIEYLQIEESKPYTWDDFARMSKMHDPTLQEVIEAGNFETQSDELQELEAEMISDRQAQDFLLETVFGIPLGNR